MASFGVENLKNLASFLDNFKELVEAAKADDGKVSMSDFLEKEVLSEVFELVGAAKNAKDSMDLLESEIKDLDSAEVMELCLFYVQKLQELYVVLKK